MGIMIDLHLSNEKRAPSCLRYTGDEILPGCVGILINHYKDPYETISIMESKTFFFFVAQLKLSCLNTLEHDN